MILERLDIRNFRMLSTVSIELASGANLFLGENAQGKTTILEAVAFLAGGRSFRTTRDGDVIPFNPPDGYTTTSVEARFRSGDQRHQLRVAIQPDRKAIYLDNQPVRRLGDLWGCLNVVLFNPSDLQLVQGPPAGRRSLLDGILAMSNHHDLKVMQNFQRALKQRNALLRSDQRPAESELASYEDQMARWGARLMIARELLVKEIAPRMAAHLLEVAGGRDTLRLVHEPGIARTGSVDEALEQQDTPVLEGILRDIWQESRWRDFERASTNRGPQRADLALHIDKRDARQYASQGQCRSLVLALRLAELDVLEARTDQPPILLLDDVLGELDRRRTSHFVKLLSRKGVQSLLTATDAAWVEGELPIAARFNVEAGKVIALRR